MFDGHGGRVNVLAEDLDPCALVLSGAVHKLRFPMLDKSVDGMFLLGYHAMAGAERAVERLAAGEKFSMPEIPSPAAVAITYKMVPDADAAESYGSKRLDGYTVEKTYGHLSELYGGNWEEYGIEQVIF